MKNIQTEGLVSHTEYIDQRSITSIDVTEPLHDDTMPIEKKFVKKLDYIYVMPFVWVLMNIQVSYKVIT